MRFYNLKCEVPGTLGPETVFDKSTTPWRIVNLHTVFDGWLGGEIMTISSCIIVSNGLKNKLSFDFSGIVQYEAFQLEKSETFMSLQPDIELPDFSRMIISDKGFVDDFAMVKYGKLFNQLIISDKAKNLLETINLGNYSITEASGGDNYD